MASPRRALTRSAYPSTPPYDAVAIRHADVPRRLFSRATQPVWTSPGPSLFVLTVTNAAEITAAATTTTVSAIQRARLRALRGFSEPIRPFAVKVNGCSVALPRTHVPESRRVGRVTG